MDYKLYTKRIRSAHITLSTLFPDVSWSISVADTKALYLCATRELSNVSVRFEVSLSHLEGENLLAMGNRMVALLP